jgi:hypothetical protein
MTTKTKRCTGCRQTKPTTAFSKDRRNSDGRQRRCRECIAAAHRALTAGKRQPAADNVWRGGNARRKFTDEQVEEMQELRARKLSYDAIGLRFDVSGDAIEKQLRRSMAFESAGKPLKAAPFAGWDFSRDNIDPDKPGQL